MNGVHVLLNNQRKLRQADIKTYNHLSLKRHRDWKCPWKDAPCYRLRETMRASGLFVSLAFSLFLQLRIKRHKSISRNTKLTTKEKKVSFYARTNFFFLSLPNIFLNNKFRLKNQFKLTVYQNKAGPTEKNCMILGDAE